MLPSFCSAFHDQEPNTCQPHLLIGKGARVAKLFFPPVSVTVVLENVYNFQHFCCTKYAGDQCLCSSPGVRRGEKEIAFKSKTELCMVFSTDVCGIWFYNKVWSGSPSVVNAHRLDWNSNVRFCVLLRWP